MPPPKLVKLEGYKIYYDWSKIKKKGFIFNSFIASKCNHKFIKCELPKNIWHLKNYTFESCIKCGIGKWVYNWETSTASSYY